MEVEIQIEVELVIELEAEIEVGVQVGKQRMSKDWQVQEERGEGLIPSSAQTRVILAKPSFCHSQSTKCKPASGICRVKYFPSSFSNCSMKNSRRSAYSFRIRLM